MKITNYNHSVSKTNIRGRLADLSHFRLYASAILCFKSGQNILIFICKASGFEINQVRADAGNNLPENGNLTIAAFIHHMIRNDKRATKIT